MQHTMKQMLVVAAVAAVVSPLLAAGPAVAAEPAPWSAVPDNVVVDPTFDPANATRVDEDGNSISRKNPCHDRAFAAIPKMLTSVSGCSIINWGNVAASKQIRGMTASGVAGVQWG